MDSSPGMSQMHNLLGKAKAVFLNAGFGFEHSFTSGNFIAGLLGVHEMGRRWTFLYHCRSNCQEKRYSSRYGRSSNRRNSVI